MKRKKLPIGIQNLREIRVEGYYYVDKTPLLSKLIDQGKHYFLSRPWRFGKSLMVDTLKELFEGHRALFEGLHAEHHWDWTKRHTVLKFSFSGMGRENVTALLNSLNAQLFHHEERLGLKQRMESVPERFDDLIRQAFQASGERVVVLIDEYDKPILDNIEDSERALAMREGLRNFYGVLKDCDPYLRFVLITGVSKFSRVNLFSGLNNLEDITLSTEFSSICGYTDNDVDTVFAPELDGLDRDEIRRWYNGYNWSGESVYNPFDLLLLFRNREFRPYWFETGTPTFLVKLLQQRQVFTPDLGQVTSTSELLSTFDVDDIPTESLMFQAGYLTLDGEENYGGTIFYRLRYPNREVEQSLNGSLLRAMLGSASRVDQYRPPLYKHLMAQNFSGIETVLKSLFASIPYPWYQKNNIADYEGYYASVFYSFLAALGLDMASEEAGNSGRLDLRVRYQGHIFIFEFKVVELAPEGRALQQIKDKGYAERYHAEGLPIHLIGIEFSREARNVVGFEVESLAIESLPVSPPSPLTGEGMGVRVRNNA